jgi:Tol biopolymer transport system component
VWVADARGDHAVPVSKGSGSDYVLGWTSGDRVLYRSTAPVDSLWTVGADGSAPRRERIDLAERIWSISVAPGHDWIVYVLPASGGSNVWSSNVWRVNLDGRGRVQLTHEGVNLSPQVTPDGATVVFVRPEAPGRPSLWKMPATGGHQERVIDGFRPAAISPDGQRIAGVPSREQGSWRVPIVRVGDGSLERKVTVRGFSGWTPDSQSLFDIVTDEGRVGNLEGQPIDGSERVQLTRFKDLRIFSVAYSPDGTRLALSRGRRFGDVVLIKNFR